MTVITKEVIKRFDEAVSRGFSVGTGNRNGQMCVEAAVCYALGLSHGDNPKCVADSIRFFKIELNDSRWSSPEARAKGLRNIGIAQIGSNGVVSDYEFVKLLVEKLIRVMIPTLFREVFPNNSKLLKVVNRCEKEGSLEAIKQAHEYATSHDACYGFSSYHAGMAAYITSEVYPSYGNCAFAANFAQSAVPLSGDKYLIMGANLALEVLRKLKSPGCKWI